MLEYLSIFVIEVIFLHVDIQNYATHQRGIHCIIMVFMWAFSLVLPCFFSRKQYHFPVRGNKRDIISLKREAQGKTIFQFCIQYLYYIFEVVLVVLSIIYGQKAIETLLKKESPIPLGGIILAMTWGAFHFVPEMIESKNGTSKNLRQCFPNSANR